MLTTMERLGRNSPARNQAAEPTGNASPYSASHPPLNQALVLLLHAYRSRDPPTSIHWTPAAAVPTEFRKPRTARPSAGWNTRVPLGVTAGLAPHHSCEAALRSPIGTPWPTQSPRTPWCPWPGQVPRGADTKMPVLFALSPKMPVLFAPPSFSALILPAVLICLATALPESGRMHVLFTILFTILFLFTPFCPFWATVPSGDGKSCLSFLPG